MSSTIYTVRIEYRPAYYDDDWVFKTYSFKTRTGICNLYKIMDKHFVDDIEEQLNIAKEHKWYSNDFECFNTLDEISEFLSTQDIDSPLCLGPDKGTDDVDYYGRYEFCVTMDTVYD